MLEAELRGRIEQGIPIEILERRLRPNSLSEAGFIGANESLLEIVRADFQIVERYATTYSEIAKALRSVIATGSVPNLDYEYITDFGGVRTASLGSQFCPWKCDDARGNTVAVILRKGSPDEQRELAGLMLDDYAPEGSVPRQEIFFAPVNTLLPHLIESHYFFEGKGSPYRADPEFLIRALNLGNTPVISIGKI